MLLTSIPNEVEKMKKLSINIVSALFLKTLVRDRVV